MAYREHVEHATATCAKCEHETFVTTVNYPATRWQPPDGERRPEECEGCGEPFGEGTKWEAEEPPEPEHRDDWPDYDDRREM